MADTDSSIEAQWPAIRKVFWSAFLSSVHYAIASVDAEGNPHVTPIGTVILSEQPGRGFFFQQFTTALPANADGNARVCVLAVNSGRLFWLRSLLTGKFPSAPAIRLYGTLGPVRKATDEEVRLWKRRVWPAALTRGYAKIWANMTMVREFDFTEARPMRIATMPAGLHDHSR